MKYAPLPVVEVLLADIFADPSYQRDPKDPNLNRLRDGWDWAQYDPIKLAYRNGKYYVTNGNHRCIVAREFEWKFLPAHIVESTGKASEARNFLLTGRGAAKPITPSERFRASVVAKDPKATALSRILRNNDLDPHGQAGGRVRCIDLLLQLVSGDPETAEVVVRVAARLCDQDDVVVTATLVKGLVYLHRALDVPGHGALYNDVVTSRLYAVGGKVLSARATSHAKANNASGGQVYATAMLAELNKRLSKKFKFKVEEQA